jgi:hypothetical protein
LVRKSEGKRRFGKYRCRLDGKVKIYLGFDGVEYIHETLGGGIEESLKNTLINIQFNKMRGFSELLKELLVSQVCNNNNNNRIKFSSFLLRVSCWFSSTKGICQINIT